MPTKPQTCAPGILTNARCRRPVLLNLGHSDFEMVLHLAIRISDFPQDTSWGRSTTVKRALQITPSCAKQTQFSQARNYCKPFFSKRLTSIPLRPVLKTNPIQSQFRSGQTQSATPQGQFKARASTIRPNRPLHNPGMAFSVNLMISFIISTDS